MDSRVKNSRVPSIRAPLKLTIKALSNTYIRLKKKANKLLPDKEQNIKKIINALSVEKITGKNRYPDGVNCGGKSPLILPVFTVSSEISIPLLG